MKLIEKDTIETPSLTLQKLKNEDTGETQQEVSHPLITLIDEGKSQPESILINTAQRLSNVAHSLIEEREKAYVEDQPGKDGVPYPTLGRDTVDSTIALCAEAREHLKLALGFRTEKMKHIVEMEKLRSGK